MYMQSNEVNGLFDTIKEVATKTATAVFSPSARAAMIGKAVAHGTATAKKAVDVKKEVPPPSPMTEPLPPLKPALTPAPERQPATWDDFWNVFKPMAVTAVRSSAPGESGQAQNTGQPQNRDAAVTQIVPYPSGQGATPPLGTPSPQPAVNYAPAPPPVVIAAPPAAPPWLMPVALGAGALLLVMSMRK